MARQTHIFVLEPDIFQAEKNAGLLSGLPPVESVTILNRSHHLVPMVCKSIHGAQQSRHILGARGFPDMDNLRRDMQCALEQNPASDTG